MFAKPVMILVILIRYNDIFQKKELTYELRCINKNSQISKTRAIRKFHDLKKIIASWVENFTRCRKSCCHFPTSFSFRKFWHPLTKKSQAVDRVIFLVNFPKTPFLFVFFLEITRIYLQRSIYNMIQTYFEKTNKL